MTKFRRLALLPAVAVALSLGVTGTASAGEPCIGGPCGADGISITIVDGVFRITSRYGGLLCTETIGSGGTRTSCVKRMNR